MSATSDWQHIPETCAQVQGESTDWVRDVAASATSMHLQLCDAERTLDAVAGRLRVGTLRGHQPGLAGVRRGGHRPNEGGT
eukprot:scaffold276_cov116-Isochrysis_galbana.AAC.3